MCGLCGVVWSTSKAAPTWAEMQRMTSAIAHRGPDDSWLWDSRFGLQHLMSNASANVTSTDSTFEAPCGAFLGHRRLSIIDLAGGRQPLSNEDGSIWVVLNGEIYNFKEQRAGLIARGHRFQTESDTEVIVHLYEERGPACVHDLRGMFAIAIWDAPKSRLFLARDRIGKKPLVYRHAQGRLAFASELKSLLELGDAERRIDPAAVNLYLAYQYVPHPHSILQGYQKLPPGHWAIYERDQLRVERYWQPPYEPGSTAELSADGESLEPDDCFKNADRWDAGRWQKELRAALTEAVQLRLRSDVPLGAFLSGGIDSTIIAGLMQEQSTTPVHTFSIGFPVPKFDERAFAQEASQHLGTQHHELVVEASGLDILPKLIWHYDEPFSDSSAIPTMFLSEMTRREVTVSLSGDGGDELFAGYDRYKAVRLAGRFDWMPSFVRRTIAAISRRIPASIEQRSFRRRLKRFAEVLTEDPRRRYLRWIGIFDDQRRQAMLHPDFIQQLGSADAAYFLESVYSACPSRDFLTQTTCADVLSYLPCDILTKVDIASMAYGLEARCPFLDQRVVELAARMPMSLKLVGQQGKQVLIDTFKDLLPNSIQTRAKMGFGVPLDHWFRNELRTLLRDVLLNQRSLSRGWFRPEAIRQLVDEHLKATMDHSYRLWNLLVFELWQQRFVDRIDDQI